MTDSPTDRPAADVVDPIEVAQRRKKIPLWVVPLFPALLVWALIYVNGVTTPPAAANTPDAMGAAIYTAKCASCHGATGGGGSGPAFANGALVKTFSKWQDQVKWVDVGSSNWAAVTGSTTYGDTKKVAGAVGQMPGWGPQGDDKSLTCSEVLLVVRYEREQFGGAAPDATIDDLATQIAAGETPSGIPNCTP